MPSNAKVGLFLDPLTDSLGGDGLFGRHAYGDYNAPYVHVKQILESLGVPVHTGDLLASGAATAELNLYVSTGLRSRYPPLVDRSDVILSAFLVQECPVAEPTIFADLPAINSVFRRIYSFADSEALQPFVGCSIDVRPMRYAYPYDAVDEEAWGRTDRQFLAMINANKLPRLTTAELYTERLRAIEHLARHGEIDLYGFGWDGPPYRIGQTRVPAILRRLGYLAERGLYRLRPDADPLQAAARRAWRGTVASKSETLSRYTFAICFENMALEGWVTEKVFDCLVAGTIPVYLGAPDIERWLDPDCFVDMRRFSGYDELREYLRSLSPQAIEAYREAGREYFRSERFRPFTKQAFADIFVQIIAEDAGVVV